MKYIKPLLKFLSLTLLALVIGLAMIPYLFKNKVLEYLKNDINANLNAVVSFADVDLSVFKSFPDLRISIDSLSLKGIEEFDNIVLYKADRSSFDVNLPSLFAKDIVPKINTIVLDNPEINIIVLDTIHANYLIMKDTTESEASKFMLRLQHYAINNGTITYQDNTMPVFIRIDNFNHSGSGDFTQDIFDLKTQSKASKLYVKYDGTTYINNVAIDLDAGINVNFPESKYTLKDNVLKFNELDMKGSGFVQLQEDDIITDFEFETASEDFKSFLSVVPNAYTKDFDKVKAGGKAAVSGKISGTYSEATNSLPVFDVKIKIDNGNVQYPALPQQISGLFADVNIKTTRPDYKDMSVNIPDFRMNIGKESVSGRLIANNLTGNQQVEGKLKGKVNLNNLVQAFPVPDMEKLKGLIQCDLSFNAKMSDINAERYDAIHFDGNAIATDIQYKSKGQPEIRIGQAYAKASPKIISFTSPNMILGNSDANLSAEIQNPLAFFSTEKQMKVSITGKSDYFDLDEWMNTESTQHNTDNEQMAVPIDEALLTNANLNLDLNAKKVKMNGFNMQPLVLNGSIAANTMEIKNFSTTIEGSDIQLSGIVVNAYDYLFKNSTLDGRMSLHSNKLDLNKFMTAETTTSSSLPMSVIPVPERVRLKIDAAVKELHYTDMILKDAGGIMEVQNQEVALHDFTTKIMGGTFGFQGLYSTADSSKPSFSLKLDLNKIKYADAFNTFELMRKAAPIAEYLDGFFNTSLVMKGVLGQNMIPVFSTLDASGLIETLNGTIKGINPLSKLSSLLGVKELNNIDLVNTRNWFEIENGFVEIKEFTKNIKGIDMTMSGKHGISQDMDYNIDLVIPRTMMKGNKITGTAETGLSMLEKEAAKIGLNIDQGPNLYVNVKMTGNLKDPKFRITPKSGKGKSIKDEVSEQGQAVVDKFKDTLNKEIKNQKDKLKDTITKRANQEIDKVKSKVEAAGQKAIDSLKSKAQKEVVSKIDSLGKGIVNDSLKQKAKDIIEKGAGDEINKIKDKLKDFNPFKNKKKG